MADAGVAARRVCEQLIEEGKVRVNGRVTKKLPVFVDPQEDRIEVSGRLIQPPARHVYIMLNKPERVLVAAADEPGLERTKVTDLVRHALAPRLFPVGRLEWDAQGLVLLTNDGAFAQRLTHPRYSVPKVYRVQVKGQVAEERMIDLQSSVRRQAKLAIKRDAALRRQEAKAQAGGGPFAIALAGGSWGAGGGEGVGTSRRKEQFVPPLVKLVAGAHGAWAEQRESQGVTLEVTLVEARGIPLRDVLFGVGLPVRRLTRVGVGGLRLGQLKVGDWRELSAQEVRELLATPSWDGKEISGPEALEVRSVADRPVRERAPTRGLSSRAIEDRERRKAARLLDRIKESGEVPPAPGRWQGTPARSAEVGASERSAMPQRPARKLSEGSRPGSRPGSNSGSGSSPRPNSRPSLGPVPSSARNVEAGKRMGRVPKGPRTILPE